MADGPLYQVTLRAEGAGPPAIIRLRGWPKHALRCHGLRAVRVEQVQADTPPGSKPSTRPASQPRPSDAATGQPDALAAGSFTDVLTGDFQ